MITIVKTNTFRCAANYVTEVIKTKVDKTNLDVMHTVIVPDRTSMEAENALLKALGGSFNVQVRTFRRLANDILPKQEYLSKQAGIIALTGIIQDKRNELTCYTKGVNTPGFVEDVYEIISMMKYCKVTPEQLLTAKLSDSISMKIKDIALLYNAYKNFTDNRYVDSADKIDLLTNAIATSKEIGNSYFYLYDFDNFSKQELAVVEQLVLHSRGVIVACCVSDDVKDKHLYLNDIFHGVTEMCKNIGIEPVIETKNDHKNKYTEVIAKRLFHYNNEKTVECGDFLEVFNGDSRVQEVYALGCRIRNHVKNGGRFKDVYVVTSDVDKYANAVATIFAELDIPYFCDKQFALSDTPYVRFVTDYLALFRTNCRLVEVLPFVKNYLFYHYCQGDVYQFENYCLKYNVSHNFDQFKLGLKDVTYNESDKVRSTLFDLITNVSVPTNATATEYVAVVRGLIKYCELNARNEEYVTLAESNSYASKVSAQAQDKLENVLKQIESIIASRTLSLDEFVRILNTAVSSIKISVLPTTNDCVVFANMAKARKHDIRYLALLGANYGAMPIIKTDNKLLTDSNIRTLNEYIALEPETHTENLREKFSLYQLLQEADKLFVSYSSFDNNTALFPSQFVDELTTMFERDEKDPVVENSDKAVYTEKQAISKVILNKRRHDDNQPINLPTYNVLSKMFGEKVKKYVFNKNGKELRVTRGAELFLNEDTTSISKITDFFACPYRFFLQYGIGVKPRVVSQLKKSDIGNILHSVLEQYVRHIDVDEDDKTTKSRADKLLETILSDDYYNGIFSEKSQRGQKLILIKECERMCKEVKYQLKRSQFTNYATELNFGNNCTVKPVEITFSQGTFNLRGKIDRVDIHGNDYIVIDYKSGKTATDYNEKALYCGEKLQLLMYAKAIRDGVNFTPDATPNVVGYFYFGLHNEFEKSNEKEPPYVYKGRLLNDVDVAKALDSSINDGKSKTLGIRLTKSNTINQQSAMPTTREQLDAQIAYATKLVERAGNEMCNGFIAVSPTENACMFCDYKDVCDYNDLYLYNERKVTETVNKQTIETIVKK